MAFKAIVKFGQNPFGVCNSHAIEVTPEYLSRYVQCWCRKADGFVYNRKANIAYFTSPEFVNAHPGLTASQLGKVASLDARWNAPVELVKVTTSAEYHADFESTPIM
jgi:hypothetical protein